MNLPRSNDCGRTAPSGRSGNRHERRGRALSLRPSKALLRLSASQAPGSPAAGSLPRQHAGGSTAATALSPCRSSAVKRLLPGSILIPGSCPEPALTRAWCLMEPYRPREGSGLRVALDSADRNTRRRAASGQACPFCAWSRSRFAVAAV